MEGLILEKNHYFHKISIYGKKESWRRLKESEKLKREFCKNNNILLIEIPCWLKPKEIKKLVISKIGDRI
jgi:hypothetical protein